MNIARNTTHGLRHDQLTFTDEGGFVDVSLMTHRHLIVVNVTLDGLTMREYWEPRRLAAALMAGRKGEEE